MIFRFLALLALPAVAFAQRTVAESSDYKSTSRHADVVAFCDALASRSPNVKRLDIGASKEGRPLPLLVLADPPQDKPAKSDKPVVLVFANIHAGEVDGKEAVLMLARDLDRTLLKRITLLVVPILNADGNERIDKKNRVEQAGPADGVGVRANADGFDLNRDFVKLETPEVRGLVKTINEWDPAVVVDMHTTNGSKHRYTLTHDGPRIAAADPAMVQAVRDGWLPAIGDAMEKETGYKSFTYGNFSADRKAWESYPASPRYGVQWLALSDRVGLLSESYSYAPYKDRVLASLAFARGICRYVADHAADVKKLVAAARVPRDRVALRAKPSSLGERTVLGFDGDKHADIKLTLLTGEEATTIVQRPAAYAIPESFKEAVETLRRHGIAVEELTEATEVDAQAYRVDKATQSETAYQKHKLRTLEVTRRDERMKLPAGTRIVRTDGRLGTLATYLLEPHSADGLATWNVFDAGVKEGADYPVLRLPKSAVLKSKSMFPPR